MVSLKTMLLSTVAKVRKKAVNSVETRLQNQSKRKSKGIDGYIFGFSSKDKSEGSGRRHKQLIWFPKQGKQLKKSSYMKEKVRVYCSCEYFNFFCAYALNISDNCIPRKAIKYAMKTPAKEKNPTNKKLLCKHLYSAALLIASKKTKITGLTKFRNSFKYVKVKSKLLNLFIL